MSIQLKQDKYLNKLNVSYWNPIFLANWDNEWSPVMRRFLKNNLIMKTKNTPQSVNWVATGSDNGLSPIESQVIASPYADLLSIESSVKTSAKIESICSDFNSGKHILKYRLQNVGNITQALMC